MPAKEPDEITAGLLSDLHPLAEQAARILYYLSEVPDAITLSEPELAGRVGQVSAQQVALVARSLVRTGLAARTGFQLCLTTSPAELSRYSANLHGVAIYLRGHRDADEVRIVLTEPGERSALRNEINSRGLPPRLFQTRDAFLNLARGAERTLTILAPFIDDAGCEFLVDLYYACKPHVQKHLICRPLAEPQCGVAFRKHKIEFRRLEVTVYEYALPSRLPSGRETFHAKVVLVDESAFYVGSSNFMASALDRSLECGVIVHGHSARELSNVVQAVRAISAVSNPATW